MSIFKKKDNPDKYHCKTIGDLLSSIASAFMMASAKNMAVSDEVQKKANIQAALMHYLNEHNIALLLNDNNIDKLRDGIINKMLPSLDKHYIIYLEPTADKQDIIWGLSYRPDGGKANEVVPQANGWLSQLNQATIFELIKKFMPNAPTATVQQ